jgi:hypothetical protein
VEIVKKEDDGGSTTEEKATPDKVETSNGKTLLDTVLEMGIQLDHVIRANSETLMSISVMLECLEYKGLISQDDLKDANVRVVQRAEFFDSLRSENLSMEEIVERLKENGLDERYAGPIFQASGNEEGEE